MFSRKSLAAVAVTILALSTVALAQQRQRPQRKARRNQNEWADAKDVVMTSWVVMARSV